ncbi:MAG: dihydrolipoamide acetyltransferase family protein [Thermodesulfobacteriota bacterium]|nr:dihydrolipoamide acetyltransferase family protein [Thermodesulfobacteriota bacterium]
MAEEIVMPKLSDTMEEGKILRWLKKEGDYVAKGEIIAEVETDKADMDLEVFSSGVLSKVLFQEGDTVPVGTVIALMGEERKTEKPPSPSTKEQPPVVVVEEGTSEEPCCTVPLDDEEIQEIAEQDTRVDKESEKPKISPVAKRLVEGEGIDVTHLKGTGPGGRIVKEDVESYLKERTEKKELSTVVTPAEKEEVKRDEVVELSKMRATIAKRMTQSKQTIPHFYVTREVDMGEATRLIDSFNKMETGEEKITYNDLVIKASALSLKEFETLNSHFAEGELVLKKEINVGVVVALSVGLLVPVVKQADTLSVKEISVNVKGLRERILKKESTPEDLSGGTFTISNMGMYGIEEFSAIINPPQVAILAVAAVKDIPVVAHGIIKPAQIMKVTLSADHRALDGVIVARFLQKLKDLLENPLSLIL